MGIDVHGLNFLKFASKQQPLGLVASIGRQGIYIQNHFLRDLLGTDHGCGPYCENMLVKHFHASSVESFDNSSYEGATFVHDFNKPLSPSKTYDTVIDYGSLEHIFNITQALANVSALCKVGGQILHALPANNYCGHGFWQFSPELFFSLYSTSNGYTETRIFIADMEDESHWYEVKKPRAGQRAEVVSHVPLILLVRTKKGGAVRHDSVQQSDYSHAWEVNRPNLGTDHSLKEVIKKFRHLFILAFYLRRLWRYLFPLLSYRDVRLSPKNGSVERKTVASICCA